MNDLNFDNRNIDEKPFRLEINDARYPKRVKAIMGEKAPKHLDMVGNVELLDMDGLGFCGSRKSSPKGLEIAQDCASQVAHENVLVVSGNAAGIDFEAHYNCLKAGGKTILVIPEGINHFRIRKALKTVWDWSRVLVVSQFEPHDPWRASKAMTRNKLVVALSRAIIIIEAGEKGGTLNAGEVTLKFGLPLYVAQHQNMSIDARGNQILLNKGAQRLAKSRSTNKANLAKIFESMKNSKLLGILPQQEGFL